MRVSVNMSSIAFGASTAHSDPGTGRTMRADGELRVGVDFDNTLVSYDRVFHDLAVERKLIHPDVPMRKSAIRDHVRTRPDGEFHWQRLQATAYGPAIGSAGMCIGAEALFRLRRELGFSLAVISHKTEFAAQ